MSRYGATLLRIALGVIFVMNGYFALFVLKPAGATQVISIPGLPLGEVLIWYLIVAHIAGGLMLVVGLKTRWAALANIPIILIALFRVHVHQGLLMTCTIVDAAAGKAYPAGLDVATNVTLCNASICDRGARTVRMIPLHSLDLLRVLLLAAVHRVHVTGDVHLKKEAPLALRTLEVLAFAPSPGSTSG